VVWVLPEAPAVTPDPPKREGDAVVRPGSIVGIPCDPTREKPDSCPGTIEEFVDVNPTPEISDAGKPGRPVYVDADPPRCPEKMEVEPEPGKDSGVVMGAD